MPPGVVMIDYKAFNGCSALTRIIIHANVFIFADFVFAGCTSLTCLYSWNPTIHRSYGRNVFPLGPNLEYIEACPCDYGSHLEDYVCKVNEPSSQPTSQPSQPPDQTNYIVSIVVPSVGIMGIVIILTFRLFKRRKYKQFKVVPTNFDDIKKNDDTRKSDPVSNDLGKFDSPTQYFKLGGEEDYKVTCS